MLLDPLRVYIRRYSGSNMKRGRNTKRSRRQQSRFCIDIHHCDPRTDGYREICQDPFLSSTISLKEKIRNGKFTGNYLEDSWRSRTYRVAHTPPLTKASTHEGPHDVIHQQPHPSAPTPPRILYTPQPPSDLSIAPTCLAQVQLRGEGLLDRPAIRCRRRPRRLGPHFDFKLPEHRRHLGVETLLWGLHGPTCLLGRKGWDGGRSVSDRKAVTKPRSCLPRGLDDNFQILAKLPQPSRGSAE